VKDPICNIEWRDAAALNANDYNPNIVFTPELRLLERSILLTGWIQPILCTKDGTIIDGFHRVRLAIESAALRKRYAGKVPCAVIDVPRDKAMVLTIRMNRAKGSHVAVRMSEIVHELINVHHCDPQEVAIEIGATKDEIDLLYQDGVFKKKDIENYRYGRAWYPKEVPAKGNGKAAAC
jgi:ParB-like chromosome segregation protein Spo0J